MDATPSKTKHKSKNKDKDKGKLESAPIWEANPWDRTSLSLPKMPSTSRNYAKFPTATGFPEIYQTTTKPIYSRRDLHQLVRPHPPPTLKILIMTTILIL